MFEELSLFSSFSWRCGVLWNLTASFTVMIQIVTSTNRSGLLCFS